MIWTILNTALSVIEQLGPEILAWIKEVCEPGEKQNALEFRMRRCKRKCRRGKFTLALITAQVKCDFDDMKDKQDSIVLLINAEINKK